MGGVVLAACSARNGTAELEEMSAPPPVASAAGAAAAAAPQPDPELQADLAVFRSLLQHRARITRRVKALPNGVQTVTESNDPEVADQIKQHVVAMHRRIKDGKPVHLRDPLFVELFANADKIDLRILETQKGVEVTETSTYPYVVKLIRAHSEVLSLFLQNGMSEIRKLHAIPRG